MWLLWILPLAAPFLLPAAGEVVDSLDSCSQFFLGRNPPNLQLNNMAIICQRYKNKYRFVTMYDKSSRIPIFSAYKLYRHTPGRRITLWKIEPQLAVPGSNETEMVSESASGIDSDLLADSQAVLKDYRNASSFDKGHLAPVCHQRNEIRKNATFTLTNTVPLYRTLNRGQWKAYENRIKNYTNLCNRTYAIVGAVSGNTLLNNRVNVPSHIWSAICCETQNQTKISWAFIAENSNQNVVNSTNLRDLESYLSGKYNISQVDLFNGACY